MCVYVLVFVQWSAAKAKVRSVPHGIAERLRRKPFFTYFLSEVGIIVKHSSVLYFSLSLSLQLPDTVNQELYSDSQLQVWAIIGLSELVAASYAEDSYGVVQRVRDIHCTCIL